MPEFEFYQFDYDDDDVLVPLLTDEEQAQRPLGAERLRRSEREARIERAEPAKAYKDQAEVDGMIAMAEEAYDAWRAEHAAGGRAATPDDWVNYDDWTCRWIDAQYVGRDEETGRMIKVKPKWEW